MRNRNYSRLGASLVSVILAVNAAQAFAAAAESAQPSSDAETSDQASQGGLADIVVTARRTNEVAQSVPVAVSVVSPELIATRGSFSPVDLANVTIGLHAAPLNNARDQVQFSIRGQSQSVTSLFVPVLPYFAEVPLNTLTFGTFFDLERVEVIKGAQGVRFGRVTDGGAVLIQPAQPTNEFKGQVEVKFGNYDLRSMQGMVNIPVVDDRIMLRGAFEIAKRDGYTYNLTTNRYLDDLDYKTFRASLLLKPHDAIENLTIFQYQKLDQEGSGIRTTIVGDNLTTRLSASAAALNSFFNGNVPSSLQNQSAAVQAAIAASGLTGSFLPTSTGNAFGTDLAARVTAEIQRQIADVDARGGRFSYGGNLAFGPQGGLYSRGTTNLLVNKTTIQLSDELTLKNIFGYARQIRYTGADTDGTPFFLLNVTSGDLPSLFGTRISYSNELQLQGSAFDSNLSWTAGFYYDKQKTPGYIASNNIASLSAYASNSQRFRSREYAGYIFGEYNLDNLLTGLKINAGYRYTDDSISANTAAYTVRPGGILPTGCQTLPANAPGTGLIAASTCKTGIVESSKVSTYEVGVSYQLARRAMVYAKYARGYRPGAINANTLPSSAGFDTYAPEYVREREIGAKIDWTLPGDMRLRTNFAAFYNTYTDTQQLVSLLVGANIAALQINVASAKIKGFELETTFIPFRGMTIGANWSYLDAAFDRGNVPDSVLFNPVNGACNPLATGVSAVQEEVFCPFNRMPFTPKHAVKLNANYQFAVPGDAGEISLGVDYAYQTSVSQIADNFRDPYNKMPAFSLVNANATWRNVLGRPMDLGLFMTNVTNNKYLATTTGRNYIGSVAFDSAAYGAPRMYGASLTVRFD